MFVNRDFLTTHLIRLPNCQSAASGDVRDPVFTNDTDDWGCIYSSIKDQLNS